MTTEKTPWKPQIKQPEHDDIHVICVYTYVSTENSRTCEIDHFAVRLPGCVSFPPGHAASRRRSIVSSARASSAPVATARIYYNARNGVMVRCVYVRHHVRKGKRTLFAVCRRPPDRSACCTRPRWERTCLCVLATCTVDFYCIGSDVVIPNFSIPLTTLKSYPRN